MDDPTIPDDGLRELVASRVEAALANTYRLELCDSLSGRALNAEERRFVLLILFAELARGLGRDHFAEIPVELLDQFAVTSVFKNHDTAGLLRSLVNSFLVAYSCPETADRAFAALLELEALRKEVAAERAGFDQKGQPEAASARRGEGT